MTLTVVEVPVPKVQSAGTGQLSLWSGHVDLRPVAAGVLETDRYGRERSRDEAPPVSYPGNAALSAYFTTP